MSDVASSSLQCHRAVPSVTPHSLLLLASMTQHHQLLQLSETPCFMVVVIVAIAALLCSIDAVVRVDAFVSTPPPPDTVSGVVGVRSSRTVSRSSSVASVAAAAAAAREAAVNNNDNSCKRGVSFGVEVCTPIDWPRVRDLLVGVMEKRTIRRMVMVMVIITVVMGQKISQHCTLPSWSPFALVSSCP